MRISDEDIQKLKVLSESIADTNNISEHTSARATTYLAIESINQIRKNTRNSIILIFIGGILGFISSLTIVLITQDSQKKELKELHNQLLEVKTQLTTYHQMYHVPKKDSLQISSKKE